MNPDHVPVFYGTPDVDVALAEIRPAVGSTVLTVAFDITKSLKVLDLEGIGVPPKHDAFDRDGYELREMHAFLSSLGDRLSAVVLPGQESDRYLMTQAFCDYLSAHGFDGMAYASAQRAGGRNIVLFPTVATDIAPMKHIVEERSFASTPRTYDETEDYEPEFSVYVTTLPWRSKYPWNAPQSSDFSLTVDASSLNAHNITGVQIIRDTFEVRRSETEVEEENHDPIPF